MTETEKKIYQSKPIEKELVELWKVYDSARRLVDMEDHKKLCLVTCDLIRRTEMDLAELIKYLERKGVNDG